MISTPKIEFGDSRWKIKRANKHIADLDALLDEFNQSNRYTVGEFSDPKTGQKFVEYGFAKRVPVEELALILGDAVHNLNCALDYAWIHAIRKVAPKALSNFAKFPVFETRHKLEIALNKHLIKTSCPNLYDFIVSNVQPYGDGNSVVWSLNRMDIRDKHRLLVPLLSVGVTDLVVEDDEGRISTYLCAFTNGGPYRKPIEPNQKLKDKGCIHFSIVFREERSPSAGLEVSPLLHRFSEFVLGVVETLERFLEKEIRR